MYLVHLLRIELVKNQFITMVESSQIYPGLLFEDYTFLFP